METFETSFLKSLVDISEATRGDHQSDADYEDLLRNIFNKEGRHGSAWESVEMGSRKDSAWEVPRHHQSLLANHLLQKTFKKGGPRDTSHATSEVEVEHLPMEKVYGREQEMRELLLKCCNPYEGNQLYAIPIVGAAGIGKTTLARLLYEDEHVLNHFEMRVWAKFDGLELNLHHAAQQILKSAMGMSCSVDDLDEMVRDALLGRRCLIVFDGVESMTLNLWRHMNNNWFGSVDLGSIVLITTPSKGVADLISSEAFEMKQLFPDNGWSLYRYLTLDFSGVANPTQQMTWSLKSLCGCNPMLLRLVGSKARDDDKIRELLSRGDLSDAISLPTFDASVAILLCIWALPLQLRQCLAFCSIFPKGFALDREKIINLWAAHGLIKSYPENNLRDIGDSYFHQLLCSSFFTDMSRNEYGDVTEFRMPGVIHKIMQDVARIVWKGKLGVISSITEDAAHLSLLSKHILEDVRTLIRSSTLYSGGGSSLDHSLVDFQELQSLDLSCSGILSVSDDICALKELRYLNLSYTLVETLPDSIAGLSQLQTLDLSCCYHFKVLPKAIREMKHVNHLDLSQCESLSHLPSGIGFLKFLTVMPLFVLRKDHDSARLGELGQLKQLRGRLDIRNLENVMEISEARDAKLNQKKLHHLGLCWSKNVGDCFEVLELLEPNRQLKVVDITGYMASTFPLWISCTTSLIRISITDCGCNKLPSLGQLPLLKELQLKGMTSIQSIGPEFYGDGVTDAFPSLEQLGLYDMPKLLEWSSSVVGVDVFVSRMFHSLKTLTVEGCPLLQSIPTFGNLLDLIVWNSNDEILSPLKGARFGSLSSLLIKNMGLGTFFKNSSWWPSLKKLILFNCLTIQSLEIEGFIKLQHLGILHCPQLRDIDLHGTNFFHKLHVAYCPNLERVYFNHKATVLAELVVDGCPELHYLNTITNLSTVAKLIIRGSDKFIGARDLKELEKLQYLSISECPGLENELKMDPSRISHIPCVLLANRKVLYKNSKDSEQVF